MENFICVACGTRYPASGSAPERCPICEDDRQYVPPSGQQWTTMDELRKGHRNAFRELAPGITAIVTEPGFSIGQQAHLVQTAAGNVLWDCVTLLDDDTIAGVEQRGGLRAIALSHPHYYTTLAGAQSPVVIRPDTRTCSASMTSTRIRSSRNRLRFSSCVIRGAAA
jgi:hypothetical protein